MLRVIAPVPPLAAAEQYALDILMDLSRVLPAADGATDGVPVRIVGTGGTISLPEARAMRWGIEPKDGGVTIDRRLLTLVKELAGAGAEQRSTAADQFGRVPPTVNELVRHGDDRDPVVHRIATTLRYSVIAAADKRVCALMTPWPNGKRWGMAMTHDLDVVALWQAYAALRVGQLAAIGELGRAARVAGSAVASIFGDPVTRAVEHILDVERRAGIRSTWFVIAGTPTVASIRAGDVTYMPESPRAKRIIAKVRAAKHEVGLHGSFESFTHAGAFVQQRNRLGAITGGHAPGVRQHFLRMRPGESHAAMTAAGFQYDSTFGFSERNGFRLGVADVLPVWDEKAGKPLALDEAPFVWMDRALSKYRNIEDPQVGVTDALAIAGACRQVEGLWTGIWHPNMSGALGFPDAPRAFEELVANLMRDDPWSTSLNDAVEFRRSRRAARGAGVTPSGDVRVKSLGANVAIEDANGKPLTAVRD